MDPVDDVSRALVLLVRSLKGLHATVSSSIGLRVELPALAVLTLLEEHGRQRSSALAELLQLDLSSVSRQVAQLEREGWVARERDPADSRAHLLHVTQAGLDVVRQVRSARTALLRELLPGWSSADLEAFAASLRRFSADINVPRSAPGCQRPPTHPAALVAAGQETP